MVETSASELRLNGRLASFCQPVETSFKTRLEAGFEAGFEVR
ncbi:hypothetical protein P0D75_22560 [Paraburkholderia sediminicola]